MSVSVGFRGRSLPCDTGVLPRRIYEEPENPCSRAGCSAEKAHFH